MKNTDYDYQFRDYSKEELRQQCVLLHQYSLELEGKIWSGAKALMESFEKEARNMEKIMNKYDALNGEDEDE